MNILLVCNYKPGVGGISGQVELLQKHLHSEGHVADIFSTKASILHHLLLPRKLLRIARGYDVLHIHCCSGWGFLPAVVGITVGRLLKKRVVLTYHGGGGEKFFDKHPTLVHHFLTRTDANIVLSRFLGKVFDQHKLPYTIIPNILEFDDSHYRERTELKPRFICTRAHEPLYNIPCILRAFQKVLTELSLTEKSESIRISQSELKELSEPISLTGSSEKNELPEATLILVGDGSQHEALMAMVNEMGLKNVTFTGRVDNNDIYMYLDQADIMLSAPTVDNMPVSILEGMNAGLLVISSNVGGVPYMVEDGKTGYLFPSDDSDTLADLMLQAVQHPEESLSIIRNAHQAVNAYRWENIKKQLYTIYGISA
ncbi:MAG: glycosyltransferase family 4 protein [Bacteroidaceae bacterium]|nr:glycosyltransferase family 4 protein [Bacteroidaceae bacterium]